jgi:MOSC domain-containing protein YiiM
MIPIQASASTREYYIRNIVSVWHLATDEQFEQGAQWYEQAHWTARMLADGDVRTGAGLLAALSPQTPWRLNVELACEAYEAGTASRHTTDSCSKANKILAGVDPEDVLPMHRKTGHFYRCILNPDDAVSVCIDRHAHDVAVGVAYGARPRGLSAHGRYALVADCYWEAAQRLRRLPSVVQAVTWVAWRENLMGVRV